MNPTRIATTTGGLAQVLSARRSANHAHETIQVKACTKRTEFFSQEMADLVARTVLKIVRAARRGGEEQREGGGG